MNASDQTKSPEMISKIAAAANACQAAFPRGEIILSPYSQEIMGEVWEEYIENSKNTVDLAIKTKAGLVSVYIVGREEDLSKCNFVVIDYASFDMKYVWEAEFDLVKKNKKEVVLSCSELGNAPSYIKKKVHELCGKMFYIFDPRAK